MKIQRVVII